MFDLQRKRSVERSVVAAASTHEQTIRSKFDRGSNGGHASKANWFKRAPKGSKQVQCEESRLKASFETDSEHTQNNGEQKNGEQVQASAQGFKAGLKRGKLT